MYGERLYLLRRVATGVCRSTPRDLSSVSNSTLKISSIRRDPDEGRESVRTCQRCRQLGPIDFMGITRVQVREPRLHLPGNVIMYYDTDAIFLCRIASSTSRHLVFFPQFSRRFANPCLMDQTIWAYTIIKSALASGHADILRRSMHARQVPIQLVEEKYNYVPPPPPDFAVSVWG